MAGKPQTLSKGQEEHVVDILRGKLLAWVTIGFTLLAGLTGASLFGIMMRTENRVEYLIAKQFQEPRIQKVVRDVAAERSSALMTQQIAPDVARFKAEIANQLKDLQSLVVRTQELETKSREHEHSIQEVLTALRSSLKSVEDQLAQTIATGAELRRIGDFMLLAVKASGDDAKAWDSLTRLAVDPNEPFQRESLNLYLSIQNRYVGETLPAHTVMPSELSAIASSSSPQELKRLFDSVDSIFHAALAQSVWEQKRFSRLERLDFMAYVLQNSPSMSARATAGKHCAAESGQYFAYMRVEPWISWCVSNSAAGSSSNSVPASEAH